MKHLVIIDDCDQTLELFLDFLEEAKISVSTFTDPKQAYKTMESNPPHLLVVDYVMPGIDGLEFIQAIREFDIYTGRVIMVSAKFIELKKKVANTIPNLEILPKPIEFESITRKIIDYLDAESTNE